MLNLETSDVIYFKHALRIDRRARANRVRVELNLNKRKLTIGSEKKKFRFKRKKKFETSLDTLETVVKGMETNNFKNFAYSQERKETGIAFVNEDQCLSINLKNDIKTIDLVASSREQRDKWFDSLKHILRVTQYRQIKYDYNYLIRDKFREADIDNSGTLTFEEILRLMDKLNIGYNKQEVELMYHRANFRKSHNNQEVLDIDEFFEFYNHLSYTKILDVEFQKLSFGGFIDCAALIDVMKVIQKSKSPNLEKECKDLISKYEHVNQQSDQFFLTSKGFQRMLISKEFEIVQNSAKVHQCMNFPLTCYYISTSHNTYLPSDQLTSSSTIETYRLYLLQGCRSVELDINDGNESTNFEPVVFHKHTLTAKVKLLDVVRTIRENAFRTSPYPVILSLENNCQQLDSLRKVATILRAELQDHLVTGPLDEAEDKWPSPEQLRGKIIIKGKKLPRLESGEDLETLEKKYNLVKELSDLVWYATSRKFTTFAETSWKYKDTTSIEERRSKRFSKKEKLHYRQFTNRYLTKVYPYGLRFFSGNFSPIEHWDSGAQMVALNYQTKTNPMAVNRALFESNANCGYVLKPAHIIDSNYRYPNRHCIVMMKILCALNLVNSTKQIIDPLVQIRVFGVNKYKRKRFRTRYVLSNGFNPQWNRRFRFKIPATNASLCFFQFRIINKGFITKNVMIGQRTIAFNLMEQGYRNIDLYDINGKKIENAKLIVALQKTWI